MAPRATTRVSMPPFSPCHAAALSWVASGPKGASTELAAMSLSWSGLTPTMLSSGAGAGKGGRPGCGVRQRVPDVPAVDPQVLVAHVDGGRSRPWPPLPVVLVLVEDVLELLGRLELLPPAHALAEPVLQPPCDLLDVQREAVEGSAVGREREARGPEGRGDLRRPAQPRVEHRAARQAMGERVAHGDQVVRRVRRDGLGADRRCPQRHPERGIGDAGRRHVGHLNLRRCLGVQHLRGQVAHGILLRAVASTTGGDAGGPAVSGRTMTTALSHAALPVSSALAGTGGWHATRRVGLHPCWRKLRAASLAECLPWRFGFGCGGASVGGPRAADGSALRHRCRRRPGRGRRGQADRQCARPLHRSRRRRPRPRHLPAVRSAPHRRDPTAPRRDVGRRHHVRPRLPPPCRWHARRRAEPVCRRRRHPRRPGREGALRRSRQPGRDDRERERRSPARGRGRRPLRRPIVRPGPG